MSKAPSEKRGDRFRAVRESHTPARAEPISQSDFAAVLRAAAHRLFGDAIERVYSQSVVNRLERGDQKPTPQDIELYASVDRGHRGKLWLAWGEAHDATLSVPRLGPSVVQENSPEVFAEPTVPEKKRTKKKRGA